MADRTPNYTGADLEDVVRRAGLVALRRSTDVSEVTMADFEAALEDSRASVTDEMSRDYAQIADKLKQNALQQGSIGFVMPGQLTPRREKGT